MHSVGLNIQSYTIRVESDETPPSTMYYDLLYPRNGVQRDYEEKILDGLTQGTNYSIQIRAEMWHSECGYKNRWIRPFRGRYSDPTYFQTNGTCKLLYSHKLTLKDHRKSQLHSELSP